jgi:integrase
MSKTITHATLMAHSKRGRLRVSDGLYLQVSKWGTKSWEYRYRMAGRTAKDPTVKLRTYHMGLGAFPKVRMAEARNKATLLAADVLRGINPVEVERAKRMELTGEQKAMTFAEAASAYIDAKVEIDVEDGGFKNTKHRQQWRNTIETYANPIIGSAPVADVDTDLVLKVLQQETKARGKIGPLWNMKTETASRLRGRIEKVLSWAAFRGLRSKDDNPARWKGHLDNELTARKDLRKPKHRAALPYTEVGAFMEELRKREGVAARALEFGVFTAIRPGNVVAATWDEIDLDARTWSIDGSKMKAGKDHQIPLCDEAVALLEALPREEGNPLVFIGTAKTGGLSENALNNVAKAVSGQEITAHGFRSTFRDWAGETTAHPREVIEHALAHRLKDKAEAAYARGTLMAKRARLMADWGRYCGIVQPKSGDGDNVVAMRSGAV